MPNYKECTKSGLAGQRRNQTTGDDALTQSCRVLSACPPTPVFWFLSETRFWVDMLWVWNTAPRHTDTAAQQLWGEPVLRLGLRGNLWSLVNWDVWYSRPLTGHNHGMHAGKHIYQLTHAHLVGTWEATSEQWKLAVSLPCSSWSSARQGKARLIAGKRHVIDLPFSKDHTCVDC